MSSRMCLLAPLALGLALSGCYDSSGRDPGADAAPIRVDAGLDPSCGARVLDLACFSHLAAGTPVPIEIAMGLGDDCFCDQDIACAARVTGDRELSIDTQLCPEVPLCRACGERTEGTCELPGLDEGRWHVVVNGESSMHVDVLPTGVIPERGATCIRRAIVDGCGASGEAQPFEVARACHPAAVPVGARADIVAFDACGGCQQLGPCRVDVFDDVIRVSPSRLANACDIACPPVCVEDPHVCVTPHLDAGTYRVLIEGVGIEGRIDVGTGAPPDEVCFGEVEI